MLMTAPPLQAGAAAQAKNRLAGHLLLVPAPELIAPVELVATPSSILVLRPHSAPTIIPTRLRDRIARLAAIRHTCVGIALEVMEGLQRFLAPAQFCLANLRAISMGLLTFAIPPLVAYGLWAQVPGWAETFPLNNVLSWGFLGGATITIGFAAAITTVLVQGVGTGIAMASRYLTRKGESAF